MRCGVEGAPHRQYQEFGRHFDLVILDVLWMIHLYFLLGQDVDDGDCLRGCEASGK